MGASQKIRLGLLQTWADADPASNLKRTLQLAHAAADQGAQIISTQELFRSQYFCQSEDHANFALAEEIPNGPSTQAFCELAKSRGVVIVASLFEKRAAGIYHNTAAVIDADGTYLGKYRKMHIPDDPLFYEQFYFPRGGQWLLCRRDQSCGAGATHWRRRHQVLGPELHREHLGPDHRQGRD